LAAVCRAWVERDTGTVETARDSPLSHAQQIPQQSRESDHTGG
jgi:hypothetical protein